MRYLLVVCVLLTAGCGVTLHPIDKEDIWSVRKGDRITTQDGKVREIQKDGWVLSDFYVKQVMQATVKVNK